MTEIRLSGPFKDFKDKVFAKHGDVFLQEDGMFENAIYLNSLPTDLCRCELRCKSDGFIVGLPFFFNFISSELAPVIIKGWEGKKISQGEVISFEASFADALSKERVALNLLSHLSAIAVKTKHFLEKLNSSTIALLDTRKTTPGLRFFERYAFQTMGGQPHRSHQTDQWMIKDNHKNFFGGLKEAVEFFSQMKKWHRPLMVEIHTKAEFFEAIELGITYVMLDNFTPEEVKKLAAKKPSSMILEVSGGIKIDTIANYAIPNVDAISVGSVYSELPKMDFSLKLFPIGKK
ncbi:MAG: carboxylating nicotinate-nucleotide diphosphorylase [Bacteriovoracaceae bacterium]|nr:carboxylating nicotinate-nucleotide diphosphorylase [Bacteriovoracaceae bacterium]